MVSLVVSNLVEKVNQTSVIFDTDEVNLNLKVISMVNIYFYSYMSDGTVALLIVILLFIIPSRRPRMLDFTHCSSEQYPK